MYLKFVVNAHTLFNSMRAAGSYRLHLVERSFVQLREHNHVNKRFYEILVKQYEGLFI